MKYSRVNIESKTYFGLITLLITCLALGCEDPAPPTALNDDMMPSSAGLMNLAEEDMMPSGGQEGGIGT